MENVIWAKDMEGILGTSRLGIYRRIQRGTLPKPLKICGRVCWRRKDWENWLELEARRQGVEVSDAKPHPPRRRRGRPTKKEQAARAAERRERG
jgi:predicted DNA-binding transcriptional regulator AlpA